MVAINAATTPVLGMDRHVAHVEPVEHVDPFLLGRWMVPTIIGCNKYFFIDFFIDTILITENQAHSIDNKKVIEQRTVEVMVT